MTSARPAPIRRLAMWSGPRNLSTAMMRSFAQRSDAFVWDEPFYAAYLRESGSVHPMGDEILQAGMPDPTQVAAACLNAVRAGKSVHYQKHMTHHMLPGWNLDWIDQVTNVFLIRHPARVIASYSVKRQAPTLFDLGFEQQLALFKRVTHSTGSPPYVLDADQFLANPKAGLRNLCTAVGLEFQPAMLAWQQGPHPDDGVWGPHWYDSIWRSTGFGPPPGPLPQLAEEQHDLLAKALRLQEPLAQALKDQALVQQTEVD